MSAHYVIRLLPEGEDRERTIQFVCDNMYKRHNSFPPPEGTPEHLFGVFYGNEIVGSLAIEFGKPDKELPFEHFFSFDRTVSPVLYEREKTIYYSRWNSTRKKLGPAIWLAVSEYALAHGMEFASSTAKDIMIEHCHTTLGFLWETIPGATIRKEHIGKDEERYFFDEKPPRPCLGFLLPQVEGLRILVEKLRAEENFVLEMR